MISNSAFLAQADVSRAAFVRLDGVTAAAGEYWTRRRAAVSQWAALLAIAMLAQSAEALAISLEEAKFA